MPYFYLIPITHSVNCVPSLYLSLIRRPNTLKAVHSLKLATLASPFPAETTRSPALPVPFNLTKPKPSQIDLASIKKDSRGNYDNPRYQPQPLAVEMKIKYESPELKKDLNDCRSYLRKNGSMRFQYAVLLVAGTRKPSKINPKRSTNSKLLYGYLDRDQNPVIYWAEH